MLNASSVQAMQIMSLKCALPSEEFLLRKLVRRQASSRVIMPPGTAATIAALLWGRPTPGYSGLEAQLSNAATMVWQFILSLPV